jgi:phosphatidylglycerophosphate synthase
VAVAPGGSLAAIKATYGPKEEGFDRAYSLLARPLRRFSFYLTLPFAWAALSANQVTLLRLALTGLGAVALAVGIWPAGAALFVCQWLLDWVDGNLARLQRRSTYLGDFLDVLSDRVASILLPAGLAIGLYHRPDVLLLRLSSQLDVGLMLLVGVTTLTIVECLAHMLHWRLMALRLAQRLGALSKARGLAAELRVELARVRAAPDAPGGKTARSSLVVAESVEYVARTLYEVMLLAFFPLAVAGMVSPCLAFLWLYQAIRFGLRLALLVGQEAQSGRRN